MKILRNILLLFVLGFGILDIHGNFPVPNLNNENEVVVFPNPATEGYISIKTEKDIAQIEILNIVGQRILIHGPESGNSVRLDISNLNAGIYLLKISFSDNTNDTKRIWVK